MEQMPDEDVLRYAPPEIRRLWRKITKLEEAVTTLQQQNTQILEALERLERVRSGAKS